MDELWDETQLLLRWAPAAFGSLFSAFMGIGYAVHSL